MCVARNHQLGPGTQNENVVPQQTWSKNLKIHEGELFKPSESTPPTPKKQQHTTPKPVQLEINQEYTMKRAEKKNKHTKIIGEEWPLLFFFGCDFNRPVFSTSEKKNTLKRHVWRWVWGPSSRGFVRIPSGFSKVDEKVLGVSLSWKGVSVSLKMGDVFL